MTVNDQGRSLLHLYADHHQIEEARRLLQDQKAKEEILDLQDQEGCTALHLACMNGDQEMVEFLCEQGAKVHLLDRDAHSLIHWITVCGHLHLFEILLRYHAPVHTPDLHHAYPIHYATQLSHLLHEHDISIDVEKALKILQILVEHQADVHCLDQQKRTPFIWAANVGAVDALKYLYQQGANPSHADKESLTALHCAATGGHTSTVRFLIEECSCSVEVKDINGCTPLFYAVTFNHVDTVRLLLDFQANPNHQDNRGRSPVHCALSKGNLDCLKELLHFQGNLNLKNKRGDYPIHEAILALCHSRSRSEKRDDGELQTKIFAVLRYILHLNPRMAEVRNHDQRTPLHLAASLGHISLCELLIACGAKIHSLVRTSSNRFRTAYDFAYLYNQKTCAEYLRVQHGGQNGDLISRLFARRIQRYYRRYRSTKPLHHERTDQQQSIKEKKVKYPLVKQSECYEESDDAQERRRIFAKSRTTLKPIDQNDETKLIIHSSNSSSTSKKLSLRRQFIAEELNKLKQARLHNHYIVINRALYKILIENAFNPQTHRTDEIEDYLKTLLTAYDTELEAIRKRTQSVPPKLARRPSQWY